MDTTKIQMDNGSGGKKDKNQNIQVFVRVRPMNSQENSKNSTPVIDTPGSREVVVRERAVACVTKTFTFDRVFGARSKQVDVYKTVVAPLLAEVLLGYNCTVFAYGQTGTGKTFTMEGERSHKTGNPVEIDPQAGILPRALSQLFDEVRLMNCEFTVRVSFLELYNEELFDLLAPIEESKTKTLRIFEDTNRKGSVIIQGLEEVIVNNKQEVYAVLDRGSQQRKTAATLMNASSSRSHTIFTITVHLKESSVEGEEMLKIGKLHLVDLAGSENIGKSGAVDKRAREAGSINQSLLTLGRVISALVERTPHVPYRESKLTRLLQDSLGGKTKTSIIATVSPALSNIEETLSTLDYAHRAKNIMNKPEVNQKLTKKEALNIYTDEIERLRRDLNATREKNGIFMDNDNYTRTMCQIQAQHAELNEKSNKIRELEEIIAEKEEVERQTALEMDELQEDLQCKQAMLEEARSLQQTLHKKIENKEKKAEELKYLVKYHLETEEKMTDEASSLLSTASDSMKVIESLHSRLDRKKCIEDRNCSNAQRFQEDFRKGINRVIDLVSELREGHTLSISEIRDKFDIRSAERRSLLEAFAKVLNTTSSALQIMNEEMLSNVGQHVELMENQTNTATGNILHHCNIARDVTRNKMKTIIESVESMRILFQYIYSENLLLEKTISVEFASMSKEVKNVIASNTSTFERLDTVLKEMKQKWCDIYTDGMDNYKNFKVSQDKYKEECNKKIDEMQQELDFFRQKAIGMQETLKLLKTETNGNLNKSNQAFKKLVTDVDNARQITEPALVDSCKSIEDAKQLATSLNGEMKNYEDRNVNQHQKFLQGLNEKLTAEIQTLSQIEETSKSVLSDDRCTLTDVSKAVKSNQQQLAFGLQDINNEMRKSIQNHGAQASSLKDSCYAAVKGINDADLLHSENLLSIVNEQCDLVSTSASKVNSLLQQTSGSVDEFWEETYLVDSPSGGTPMRRKYEIPSKLTLPSPHDRVMSRYRAVSRDVELALEDITSMREDLDCSWSDNYFKNLDIQVAEKPNEEQAADEFGGEGRSDDIENENPTDTPSDNKLETIQESMELKENCADSEFSSVSSSEDVSVGTPRVQSQKLQQPAAATTGKKLKCKPKYFGKKGVLKPPN